MNNIYMSIESSNYSMALTKVLTSGKDIVHQPAQPEKKPDFAAPLMR